MNDGVTTMALHLLFIILATTLLSSVHGRLIHTDEYADQSMVNASLSPSLPGVNEA